MGDANSRYRILRWSIVHFGLLSATELVLDIIIRATGIVSVISYLQKVGRGRKKGFALLFVRVRKMLTNAPAGYTYRLIS